MMNDKLKQLITLNDVIARCQRMAHANDGTFKWFLPLSSSAPVLIIPGDGDKSAISIATQAKFMIILCRDLDEAKYFQGLLNRNKISNYYVIIGSYKRPPFMNDVFKVISMHRHNVDKSWISNRLNTFIQKLEFSLQNNGVLYISYHFPQDITIIQRLFGNPCKIHASSHLKRVAKIFHYHSFSDLCFVRICWYKKWLKYDGLVFSIKRIIFGNNVGVIFKKDLGCSSNRNEYLLKKYQDQIESHLKIRLTRPNLLRSGSGGSIVIDFGEVIVRIPSTEAGLIKCKKNFEILKIAASMGLSIPSPVALCFNQIEGQYYFVESKISGLSMDLNKPSKEEWGHIQDEAYRYLIDHSIIFDSISAEYYDEFVQKEVTSLESFLPESDLRIIISTFEHLKAFVLEEKLNLVMQHGDFKASNFITSMGPDKKLVGIIDWDMSLIPGLPLMDLLTMTIYGNQDCHPTFVKNVWPLVDKQIDAPLVSEYIEQTKIGPQSLKFITLCYILQYQNNTFYLEDIKKHPIWYKETIKECLLPLCLSFTKEISGKPPVKRTPSLTQ